MGNNSERREFWIDEYDDKIDVLQRPVHPGLSGIWRCGVIIYFDLQKGENCPERFQPASLFKSGRNLRFFQKTFWLYRFKGIKCILPSKFLIYSKSGKNIEKYCIYQNNNYVKLKVLSQKRDRLTWHPGPVGKSANWETLPSGDVCQVESAKWRCHAMSKSCQIEHDP